MFGYEIAAAVSGYKFPEAPSVSQWIRHAQQFYLGEASDIYRGFEEFRGNLNFQRFLSSPWSGFLRPPFPFTLFCYKTTNKGRYAPLAPGKFKVHDRAVLVMTEGADLLIHCFYRTDNIPGIPNGWFGGLCVYRWHPGQHGIEPCFWPSMSARESQAFRDAGGHDEDLVDIATALSGIVLLNCRNVTTRIEPGADPATNRRRIAAGKKPLLSYHVLYIRTAGHRKGQSEPTGSHSRLHLCRGHFKRYTEDAPLFGRYVGAWFWQPHVRGQDKTGVVLKDYDVSELKAAP